MALWGQWAQQDGAGARELFAALVALCWLEEGTVREKHSGKESPSSHRGKHAGRSRSGLGAHVGCVGASTWVAQKAATNSSVW